MSKESTAAVMGLFFSTSDLVRVLTVSEAEDTFRTKTKSTDGETIPFGALQPEWRKLVRKIAEGDELWEFSHPSPNGTVFRGIKLVRGKQVIDAIVATATTAGASSSRSSKPAR